MYLSWEHFFLIVHTIPSKTPQRTKKSVGKIVFYALFRLPCQNGWWLLIWNWTAQSIIASSSWTKRPRRLKMVSIERLKFIYRFLIFALKKTRKITPRKESTIPKKQLFSCFHSRSHEVSRKHFRVGKRPPAMSKRPHRRNRGPHGVNQELSGTSGWPLEASRRPFEGIKRPLGASKRPLGVS